MDWSLIGFGAAGEMFNIHPLFVHFPAALLPSALLLYGLGVLLKRPQLAAAGRACLYLGTAGALAALVTGLRAEDTFPHNSVVHGMMEVHELMAWLTLSLSAVLAGWGFFRPEEGRKSSWAFLLLLGLANLVMMQGADIGARMVYLQGAAVRPAVKAEAGEPAGGPAAEGAVPAGEGHRHDHR